MTHDEFIQAHSDGTVRFTLDKSLCNRLIDTEFIPGLYTAVQLIMAYVGAVGSFFGIWASCWYQTWPYFLLAAVSLSCVVFRGKVERFFVLRHALGNRRFYDLIVEQKILEFPED